MVPPTCNGPIPLPAAHIRVTLPDLSDDPLSHKNVGDAHYYIEHTAIAYSERQCTLIWIYRLKVPYIEDTLDTTDDVLSNAITYGAKVVAAKIAAQNPGTFDLLRISLFHLTSLKLVLMGWHGFSPHSPSSKMSSKQSS